MVHAHQFFGQAIIATLCILNYYVEIVFNLKYANIDECFSGSGCGVTANIPVLGTGDSGFESRHPDKSDEQTNCFVCVRDSKIF